jgi:large subunit ribosomal protein L28
VHAGLCSAHQRGFEGAAARFRGSGRAVSTVRRKLYSPAMAKVCHVCRKGPAFGNTRSHSMVATRRRFDPNLQRVRIDDNGTPRRVYVCTRCLKAGKVAKAK